MNTRYQDLFNYLANELNVIATQTQMQEIEEIILKKIVTQLAINAIFLNQRHI